MMMVCASLTYLDVCLWTFTPGTEFPFRFRFEAASVSKTAQDRNIQRWKDIVCAPLEAHNLVHE